MHEFPGEVNAVKSNRACCLPTPKHSADHVALIASDFDSYGAGDGPVCGQASDDDCILAARLAG